MRDTDLTYVQVMRVCSEYKDALLKIALEERGDVSTNADKCLIHLNGALKRRVLNEIYKSVGLEPTMKDVKERDHA